MRKQRRVLGRQVLPRASMVLKETTKMIDVVIVGAPEWLRKAVEEELKKMGRDDIKVASSAEEGIAKSLAEIVKGDDCPLCEIAAEMPKNRSVYVHKDIALDDEGYVKDKVRHRLFKSPAGDVFFFDQLFHPMHELHMFAAECERGAQGIYHCKPALSADGEQLWHVMDWSDGKREVDLDHCGGELENVASQKRAQITMISGPLYEKMKAAKLASLN